jgi:hypothetical protein
MPLQAPVQRRLCQLRDSRLQSMDTIVWRQQRMTPECDDRSVFGLGQDGGSRLFRSGLEILGSDPLSPFGHRLRDDAQSHAQLRERSLRSLQCSSDSENGRGACAANFSH